MKLVILGLSITSSWGNGHATTYRGLVRELVARGHDVLFLERDVPWYADNRDMRRIPGAKVLLYKSLAELRRKHVDAVRSADAVIVGSYVPEGIAVGEWVVETADHTTAFYDIDTPVTLAKLGRNECEYLSPALIPRYDVYLSFTGGPTLRRIEQEFGSPRALPLYCSVDPRIYFPDSHATKWHLGYLGTYSPDRQPTLDRLLVQPAAAWADGRFVVAGPQYPKSISWPDNVDRIEHLPPQRHRAFYNRQRFTLNVTRADMIAAGYSPSVRLFEAAACGCTIVTDTWPGLETFFEPGREILPAHSSAEVLAILRDMPREAAARIGAAARAKVLAHHTAAHRAEELETYLAESSATVLLPPTRPKPKRQNAKPKTPAPRARAVA